MATRLLLLCALLQPAAAFSLSSSHAVAAARSVSTISMAHHVEKKATRKANAFRPKKSRPSDRNRKPPSYPAIPDVPWMVPIASVTKQKSSTVSINVEPSDTAESVRNKLTSAGAAAPAKLFLGGVEVTGSLADAGLASSQSLDAVVYSPA